MDKISDPTEQDTANERVIDELLEKHFDKDLVDKVNDKKCDSEQDNQEESKEDDVDAQGSDTDGDEEEEEEVLSPNSLMLKQQEVLEWKERGNSCFRKGEFEEAIKHYQTAGALCKHKELYQERAILYSNRAASELKLNLPKPAIHSASRAIKYNPGFAKGYLRSESAVPVIDVWSNN